MQQTRRTLLRLRSYEVSRHRLTAGGSSTDHLLCFSSSVTAITVAGFPSLLGRVASGFNTDFHTQHFFTKLWSFKYIRSLFSILSFFLFLVLFSLPLLFDFFCSLCAPLSSASARSFVVSPGVTKWQANTPKGRSRWIPLGK